MNLSKLLGRRLKDDEILRVLYDYRIDRVTYDFDRNHENMEDIYWAAADTAGFLLRFNQTQILDVVFCYVTAREGFSPIDLEIIGAPMFDSFDAAEAACKHSGQDYRVSDAALGPKFHKLWLRIDTPERATHYQFEDGRLVLVTLMLSQR